MPTERVPLQRPRRGHVTNSQWWELRLGPGTTSVFSSREELKDAWQRARERMLASMAPGRRPQAYYEFEYATGHRPSYDLERSTLWRKNLLTADEKIALETEWKLEFQRAQALDFTLNDGDGLLKGGCARTAHYAWADIPPALVKRWSAAARRRRSRMAPEKAPDVVVEGEAEETHDSGASVAQPAEH
jgi:hypothetical protein